MTSGGSSASLAAAGLAVEHITKRFGATRALDDVSLRVTDGAIHGLLGGNGSGKSTLIKVLAGLHRADGGGLVHVGADALDVDLLSPATARDLGLRFVHQNPGVFPQLTVAENIALGSSAGFPTSAGRVSWARLRRATRDLLDRYQIDVGADVVLGDLRPADQTMIAIARSLQSDTSSEARVLVLDEPTASLPQHEVDVLLGSIRRFVEGGQSVLYVSHRLEEVMDLVDEITVLRDGRHVITRSRAGLTKNDLVDYIVGRPVETVFSEAPAHAAAGPVAIIEDVWGGPLRGVNLTVNSGEVVGIAGLLGSGRTELLRMVFGDYPVDRGGISIPGAGPAAKSPAKAMSQGIAYIPEDRSADSAFLALDIKTNLTIARLGEFGRRFLIRGRSEHEGASVALREYGVKAAGLDALMSSLSGGNQQKVVLARWLARNPRLILLDEPTQGVDVGARSDLYTAIRGSVAQGAGALLVSSDFEELAHACDRVVILRRGRIAHEVQRSDLTAHRLTQLLNMEEAA